MTSETCKTAYGLIFDVDGTMVDNAAWHRAAWLELGRRRGIPITESFYQRRIHSRNNPEIIAMLRAVFPDAELPDNIEEEKEIIYRELYRPRIRVTPGLLELLEGLASAGVPLAAASNSPWGNVAMIFEELGISGYFPHVFTPDMGLEGKPSAALYRKAAGAMGLPLSRCLVFEDSVSGFRACEAAGVRYIVILYGADAGCLEHARNAAAFHDDFTAITPETIRRIMDVG
jgi:beta-phosphoglucomutase